MMACISAQVASCITVTLWNSKCKNEKYELIRCSSLRDLYLLSSSIKVKQELNNKLKVILNIDNCEYITKTTMIVVNNYKKMTHLSTTSKNKQLARR